jgi:hypothetical protein
MCKPERITIAKDTKKILIEDGFIEINLGDMEFIKNLSDLTDLCSGKLKE